MNAKERMKKSEVSGLPPQALSGGQKSEGFYSGF